MNRLSLNSWSLNEMLGPSRFSRVTTSGSRPQIVQEVEEHPEKLSLLSLPAELAARGIGAVDICYFHMPTTDPSFLQELRAALQQAGVELFCLLIDFGDLTQPDSEQRELEIKHVISWIYAAGQLGALCARPVAGNASATDQEALKQAVQGYLRLASVAEDVGVRLLTENLGAFTRDPDTLLTLLDRLEGKVGLVADFGNGRRVGEYNDLKRLLARAESAHAKPEVRLDGTLEEADFLTCVRCAEEVGYTGPYTIVYRGPWDPWKGIEKTKALIESGINAAGSSE